MENPLAKHETWRENQTGEPPLIFNCERGILLAVRVADADIGAAADEE